MHYLLKKGVKMPYRNDNPQKKINLPWITKDGHLDLTKFPLDSILKQAISGGEEKFHSACQILGAMASAGRTEAGVFIFGLLRFCGDDVVKRESVVKALGQMETAQAADLLFDELNSMVSSNSTRGYINTVLSVLKRFPLDLVEEGFERLLSDTKWTYKMKRKFRSLLEEIRYR